MPKPQKQVYYAHAMCLYGHSLEQFQMRCIRAAFPGHRIINPGGYDEHPEKHADVLGFCYRLIDGAEGVVFTRLLGKVTAGVGAEVNYALASGKEVFELREEAEEWRLTRVERPVRYVSRDATIRLYRKFQRLHPL